MAEPTQAIATNSTTKPESLEAYGQRLLDKYQGGTNPRFGELEPTEADERRKRCDAFLDSAGLRYKVSATLNQYEPSSQAKDPEKRREYINRQQTAKDTVTEWAETFNDHHGQNMVLYGPVGTGKDHLAIAAVRFLFRDNLISARWVNFRDVVADNRDRITEGSKERDFINKLCSPKVLIVSDPVPQQGTITDAQSDLLYRMIEYRTREMRTTILTVNVADDQDAKSKLGVPTWDRLCHNAWKIHCAWPSYRQPARVV